MALTKITSPRFDNVNLLVYGEPGTWKSRALTTFTKGRILLLQSEPGIITPMTFEGFSERADVFAVEDWKDFSDLRKNPERWLKANKINLSDYGLIALDGVTELLTPVKKWILQQYPTKAGDRLDRGTWGLLREEIRGFCLALCKLPIRVYVTAQLYLGEVESVEEQKIIQMFLPATVGAFRLGSGHLFDFVMRSRVDIKGRPWLQTKTIGNIIAKTRGVDIPKEVPFNLDDLYDLIEKQKGGAAEEEEK